MKKELKSKIVIDGILLNRFSYAICYLIFCFENIEKFIKSLFYFANKNIFFNRINQKKKIYRDECLYSEPFLYEKINQLSTDLNIQNNFKISLYYISIDNINDLKSKFSLELIQNLISILAFRLMKYYKSNENASIFRNFKGDFYLIILEKNDRIKSELICNEIFSIFNKPIHLDFNIITLSCSIGYSIHSKNENISLGLIQEAELALNEAQKSGYGSFYLYSDYNQKYEYLLEKSLKEALLKQHLSLYFQPVYHIDSKTISHYEALSRWKHEFNGFISPEKFISIAEKTGQIHEIGRWLILETFSYLLHWEQTKIDLVPIAINLSPKQFEDHSIFIFLKKLLKSHEFIVNYLYLEITESLMLMNNEQNINILQELRELGLKVYLDDFGTGFSSLNYLIHFPIDGIKIDRIFVENLLLNNKNYNIIKNLISMAHALGLEVIAEGVETNEQMEILMDLDCQYFQGYLLSKPFPIEKVTVNN